MTAGKYAVRLYRPTAMVSITKLLISRHDSRVLLIIRNVLWLDGAEKNRGLFFLWLFSRAQEEAKGEIYGIGFLIMAIFEVNAVGIFLDKPAFRNHITVYYLLFN